MLASVLLLRIVLASVLSWLAYNMGLSWEGGLWWSRVVDGGGSRVGMWMGGGGGGKEGRLCIWGWAVHMGVGGSRAARVGGGGQLYFWKISKGHKIKHIIF